MSGPTKQSASPRRGRILLFVAAGFVAVLVVLGITLKILVTPERLRTEVVRGLSNALGVEPTLDRASLKLIPFGAKIEGFEIPGAALGDSSFLAIDEGHLRVSLLPLLKRALVVDEVRLVGIRMHVRSDGDRFLLPGKLGASAEAGKEPAPTGAPASPSPLSRLAVRSYAIERGGVHIVTPDGKGDVHLEGITLHGTLDSQEGGRVVSTDGTLALDGLSLAALSLYEQTLKQLKPELRYRLVYDGRAGVLRIDEAMLVAKPLELGGKGEIRGIPKEPVLEFAIDPKSHDVAELVPLVPTAIVPEDRALTGSGRAEIGGRVTMHLADKTKVPDYELLAAFDDLALGIASFPAGVEHVTGKVHATAARLTFHDVKGVLAGEPFRIHGTVDDPSDSTRTRFDLAIQVRAKLDTLARSGFAPPGAKLSGTIDADVVARGAAADPKSTKLEGNIVAEGVHAVFPNMRLPIENGRARVRMQGDRAIVESFAARIGRSSFDAHGEIRTPLATPEVILVGRAPILDLNELFPPASRPGGGADSSQASALFQFVVGTAHAAAPAPPLVPVVPPFPMNVELAVDSLFTGQNIFTGATFHAKSRDGRATVDGRFAHAQLGTVVMRDLTANATIADETLQGTFAAPRADAPRVPLTDVKGSFRVDNDRKLEVNDVTARLWSGAVKGRATVDLTDLASPAFRIESSASRVQANDLMSSLTPAKGLISGTMDMTSVISGKGSVPEAIARTLAGGGDIHATGGKIALTPAISAIWTTLGLGERQTIEFNDLASAFQLDGGRIVTKDLAIRGGDATWNAKGAIGLDGALDYDIEVELAEEAANTVRKRMGPDLAQFLAGSTGQLTLDLKLRGNARSPKVTLDTAKLAERARENATNSVRKSLEKEAGKALEKLFGSSADSSDSTAPTGAAKPESTVKNLLEGLFKRK